MIKNIININNDLLKKDINIIFSQMNEKMHIGSNGLLVKYSFDKEYSFFNEDQFNIFTTYNKQINHIYQNIAKCLKELNLESKLNSEKSMQHITGNLFYAHRSFKTHEYDYVSSLPGCYFGLYVIDSNNSTIYINDEETNLNDKDLLIISGNKKINFKDLGENFNAIEFYIMPLHYLNGQYYQKWCPVIC